MSIVDMPPKSVNYDPLGVEIKRLRHALGETQRQFAKRLRVSRTILIRWERYQPPKYWPVRHHLLIELGKVRAILKMRKRKRERQIAALNL